MPNINQVTEIYLSDEDLPQRPGQVKIHQVGVYQVTIEIPVVPDPDNPATGGPRSAWERFAVVDLNITTTKYVHAAELISTTGGRRRVTDFALCSGKRGGRPVRGRARNQDLHAVTCPRCIRHLAHAGVVITPTSDGKV